MLKRAAALLSLLNHQRVRRQVLHERTASKVGDAAGGCGAAGGAGAAHSAAKGGGVGAAAPAPLNAPVESGSEVGGELGCEAGGPGVNSVTEPRGADFDVIAFGAGITIEARHRVERLAPLSDHDGPIPWRPNPLALTTWRFRPLAD